MAPCQTDLRKTSCELTYGGNVATCVTAHLLEITGMLDLLDDGGGNLTNKMYVSDHVGKPVQIIPV